MKWWITSSKSKYVLFMFNSQGHLTTVKYLFGEAKIAYRIFFNLKTARKFRELFHSCKIFEPYLLSSLRFLIFSFYFPIWAIFLRKKETQNFRIQKCDGERNQETPHRLS